MTPHEFIAKWQAAELKERAACQEQGGKEAENHRCPRNAQGPAGGPGAGEEQGHEGEGFQRGRLFQRPQGRPSV